MNAAICGIFLNATLQAAVHLGQDYAENLRFVQNHLWKSVKQLFKEPEKLIRNQTEITGVTTIDYQEHTWRSTSLSDHECRNLRLRRLSALSGKRQR